jgi:carbonic anhydrase
MSTNMSTLLDSTSKQSRVVPAGAEDALQKLIEGNHRFVNDVRSLASFASSAERRALAAAQSPFAVVLSCSDSRVPAEIVFDQGLGSLFVVRVAGNVVAPSLVGSIEYAVHSFGSPLVLVMGHTGCGAVKATIEHLRAGASATSENVLDIVERISPAVAPLVAGADPADLLARATQANVLASVAQLQRASHLLAERVAANKLLIVGAEYSLETGVVSILDHEPAKGRTRAA